MQERNSKQEEALFTLLMDQVARQENRQAREAMERLARDPSAAVPALSQRRCMQTIQRGLLRRDLRSAGRVLRRLAGRAAVILAVAALCFSVAFAVSPTLRSQTVRWVVETFDTHTLLRPGSRTDRSGGSSLRADGEPAAYRGDPDGNKPEPGDLVLPLCRRRRLLAGDQADGFQRRRRHVRGHGGRRYAPADHQRLSRIHHPQKRDVHRRVHAG